ncbi:MAG: phosphoenolpyruvate kinase [Longimicrobiales bacterium]
MAESQTVLQPAALGAATAKLEAHDIEYARRYPGDSPHRQPVHTVYGGAQLFKSDAAPKLAQIAQRMREQYAPDAGVFTGALGVDVDYAPLVHQRVCERLADQGVEDFRIDFEDGYGNRRDAEEDGHAAAAAREVATGMRDGVLPPFIGIRIKPMTPELRGRAVRTLDIFMTTLLRQTGGALPSNFVVTLPKLTSPAHADYFASVLDAMETALGLTRDSLRFEFMVETPQILIGPDGRCPLPLVLEAARGRAVAAHFGTYDYTASCNITAAEQRMRHPVCDHARHIMQVALAGTGVWLSDGSTAVLPVPPHRAAEGSSLSAVQMQENRDVVHRAWKLHYDDVQDSLMRGYYQGWDLHPAQLVTRYAALFDFFLRGLQPAGDRLHNFLGKAAQATLLGDMFDDAATGQGLLNFFLRAINAGAVTEDETMKRTGLTLDELQTRSFVQILKGRTA